MGDQADGMEYFSALDDAFQKAQLPEPPLDDQHHASASFARPDCHYPEQPEAEASAAAQQHASCSSSCVSSWLL